MKWEEFKKSDSKTYEIPTTWLHMEYYEALNVLFRVENALRLFVYIILKDKYFENWKTLQVTADEGESGTIKSVTNKRIHQDKQFAYLGYVINSPLLHLTAGELIKLIFSDANWKSFQQYFLGSKTIIETKLDEISNVRNCLAHFRPIRKGDVDLIKQNALHTMSGIEEMIVDFISCRDTVPSNTDDLWFKELSTIGTDDCKMTFLQTKDEKFIEVRVIYTCHIFSKTSYSSGYYFKLSNLKVDKILLQHADIIKFVICATESLNGFVKESTQQDIFKKFACFKFSRQALTNNLPVISEAFRKLLSEISSEINLIKSDNLARGKLIEIISTWSTKPKTGDYHGFSSSDFYSKPDNNTPVEFWGHLNFASSDFVTKAYQYPWMPTTVSEDELPF